MRLIIAAILATPLLTVADTFQNMATVTNWAEVNIDNQINIVLSEITERSVHTNRIGDNAAVSDPVRSFDPGWQRGAKREWQDRYAQRVISNIFTQYIPPARAFNLDRNSETNIYRIPLAYSNWSDFATVAGLSTNGFRRAVTNWPQNWQSFDDPAYTYGFADRGDIRGPWVKDDLQRAVSCMKYSLRWAEDPPAVHWSCSNGVMYQGSSHRSTNGYDAAISSDKSSYIDYTDEWNDGRTPEASGYVSHDFGNTFYVFGYTYKNKLTLTVPPHTVRVFFYVYATAPGTNTEHYSFNANGSGLLENQWKHIDTVYLPNLNTETNIYSDYIGNNSYPEIPPPPGTNEWHESGWKALDAAAIIEREYSFRK